MGGHPAVSVASSVLFDARGNKTRTQSIQHTELKAERSLDINTAIQIKFRLDVGLSMKMLVVIIMTTNWPPLCRATTSGSSYVTCFRAGMPDLYLSIHSTDLALFIVTICLRDGLLRCLLQFMRRSTYTKRRNGFTRPTTNMHVLGLQFRSCIR